MREKESKRIERRKKNEGKRREKKKQRLRETRDLTFSGGVLMTG